MPKAQDVSSYIAAAAPQARPLLRQLRVLVKSVAPQAEEKISYSMPYYGYHGRLVYFAAFRNHVSFFIWGPVVERFAKQLLKYKTSKGTLQFPFGEKLPIAILKKLIKGRMQENAARAKAGVSLAPVSNTKKRK